MLFITIIYNTCVYDARELQPTNFNKHCFLIYCSTLKTRDGRRNEESALLCLRKRIIQITGNLGNSSHFPILGN